MKNWNLTKKGTNKSRQLGKHAHYIRNKDFKPIMVKSSDSSTGYWVSNLYGYLNDIPDEVNIIISKRHPKDRNPDYFMSTDLSLNPQAGLCRYGRRLAVGVDHLYLKVRLGLGIFGCVVIKELLAILIWLLQHSPICIGDEL